MIIICMHIHNKICAMMRGENDFEHSSIYLELINLIHVRINSINLISSELLLIHQNLKPRRGNFFN